METELKFSLDPGKASRLTRHPRLAGLHPRRRRLLSLYFDTPDLALKARRVALRLRRVGYHWIQGLKGETRAEGALSRRPEWEVAVAAGEPDPSVLPAEARALLQGVDLAALVPVFQTDIRRTTWEVIQGASRVEVALDRGEIRAGDTVLAVSEVELELISGQAADLLALAGEFLADVPLGVDPRSKAERGFMLHGFRAGPVRGEAPALAAAEPAAASRQAILAAALAQLVANVPGFLERPEEPEYLHQLRVALRRLRGVAGLGRALGLPRPVWSDALAAIMADLNPARDWDVFLQETLPRLQPALAGAPLDEAFQALMGELAAQARRVAQKRLASTDFTGLVLALGTDLLAATAATAFPRTDAWSGAILKRRWKRLRGYGRRAASLGGDERHRARLAAKKLRYAADALAGLYGKRGRPFIRALARLQDRLGEANDLCIGIRLMAGIRDGYPAHAFEAGRVSGALAARQAGRWRKVAGAWRALGKVRPFWTA